MSQADRILKLLQTGPKTTAEILAVVPSVVHSRIAQLRERGYDITCTRTKGEGAGGFLYTLLSEPDTFSSDGEAGNDVGPEPASSGSLSGVGELAVTSSAAANGEGDALSLPSERNPDSCAAQLTFASLWADEAPQDRLGLEAA